MLKRFFLKKNRTGLFFIWKKKANLSFFKIPFFKFNKRRRFFYKVKSLLFLSALNLFLNLNSIFIKKLYFFFIKYNSYTKQKRFAQTIFLTFKLIFKSLLKRNVRSAFSVKLKGKFSSKAGSKKKKINLTKGSFFNSYGKKCFFDQKASSSKQGCVNFRLVFKIK